MEDFVVLDCEIDHKITIILQRPFLEIYRALIDIECGDMKFWVHNGEVSYHVWKIKKQPMELKVVCD